jgi:hypothetical protein
MTSFFRNLEEKDYFEKLALDDFLRQKCQPVFLTKNIEDSSFDRAEFCFGIFLKHFPFF